MEGKPTKTLRLFLTSSVETKDDLDEKLERSYQLLQTTTSGLSDRDACDALTKTLLKEKGYEEVSLGLLVSILSEPQNAPKAYHNLTLLSNDGFALVLQTLVQIVLERYLRFTDTAKTQTVWLLREMIKNAVNNVDNICWNLMRHAAGGDISPKNLLLIESILDLFIEYRNWLEKFPLLIASVVYTFLRLIEDHNAPYLSQLRQKEVTFLISLIRDRFIDCIAIGRDFVRLLQNVARIPEFEQLWKDILQQPKTLHPQFNGISHILQLRTSRRYLQSRLTPDMERKLVFFTSQVRFGNHKRYQDWFQRQYLATPESQSLRCDIIRFIVGVIHPTNELLCSDIIPRWAVIGWLLTTCTSSVAVSNAKLALFYDWLFFDSEKDNIMNIEPAILVMHHSLRSHPAVSATLLDFLCRIIPHFHPPLTDKVRAGIFASLRKILEKRVVQSLVPLFDNAKLDPELRNMVRDTFREFCGTNETTSRMEECGIGAENHSNHVGLDSNEPAFSDDEDEGHALTITTTALDSDDDDDNIPLSKVRLKEKVAEKGEDGGIGGLIGELLTKLQQENEQSKRCEYMDGILKELCENEDYDDDDDDDNVAIIAKSLSCCLEHDLKAGEIFPSDNLTNEQLLNSIKLPLFQLYKVFYNFTKQNSKRILLKLYTELRQYHQTMGYLLLYYLKVQIRTENKKEDQTKASAMKVSVYKELCQFGERKLDACLLDDMQACHMNDTKLMLWLVPDLFRDFKQQTVNNAQIIRVIISAIDSKQLQTLVGKVLQGHLVTLKSDNIQQLLKISLTWESIEQFFFWQLIHAHDIAIDTILPLVPQLDYEQHSEALTAITLMLKQEKPNADYVKYLFLRHLTDNGDLFIFTMIKYWCDEYIDKVAELISSLLSSRYPSTSPNKRKRTGTKNANSASGGGGVLVNSGMLVPNADQVLGHLEQLRVICERHDCMAIYTLDSMQRALNIAQTNSNDSQKKQFGQLFALLEEEEEVTSATKSRAQGRGRKAVNKTQTQPNKRVTTVKEVSESSEESSEEEEIVKPKQPKKRKKVMSDSD